VLHSQLHMQLPWDVRRRLSGWRRRLRLCGSWPAWHTNVPKTLFKYDNFDDDGVVIGDERIRAKTVVWTAGVAASPAGKWLDCEMDRTGRVRIQRDLTIPRHPEIFVIGDTASLDQDGRPLPGVAQVAMQQGKYVAKSILRKITGHTPLSPFRYFDKGNLAVVGKNFAILQSAGVQLSGFVAWLGWAFIHIRFLAENSLRFSVFLQWVWTYFTGKRVARLIIRERTNGLEHSRFH